MCLVTLIAWGWVRSLLALLLRFRSDRGDTVSSFDGTHPKEKVLVDFFTGRLGQSEEERQSAQKHLEVCRFCSRLLKSRFLSESAETE